MISYYLPAHILLSGGEAFLAGSVSVSRSLLEELYEHFAKMEEILATLEELADKEGLERMEKGLRNMKGRSTLPQ